VLRDAASGVLKPIYNFLNDLPSIQSAPVPFLLRKHVRRTAGNYSTFDAGRGCPYQCSFCTIINVQGRKSRRRSPDDVERIIRQNCAEGVHRFFITDDNLARNKDWEPILDRIIKLRTEEDIGVSLMIQVDALCHKIPNFVEKCAKAGVTRVFIGIESINPDALIAAKKRQNKITQYRELLLAWKAAGAVTYAGYILGFPTDTPGSIRRDIEIIQRELPIDMMEFFCLTPLPGSEDHQILYRKGVAMDPDMNKYDTEHAVTAHPKMTQTEWEEIYRAAWDLYYTPAHLECIMRRAGATGIKLSSLAGTLLHFSQFTATENVHPLQGGIFRLKFRRDRRPTFAIEAIWTFYPGYLWETAGKLVRYARAARHLYGLAKTIKADPRKNDYMDQALTPVVEEDLDSLELFNQNAASRNAVQHERHVRELTRQ
jgi:radical SAM family protein